MILDPCPFCGAPDPEMDNEEDYSRVRCRNCGAEGPSALVERVALAYNVPADEAEDQTNKEAAFRWNQAAQQPTATPAVARKFTLVVRGDTEMAYEEAISEATRLLNQGYLAGANSNDEGGFYFSSTDEIPEGDMPA